MKKQNYDITLISIVFPTRVSYNSFYYVPVGVLSLASYLKKENFSVEVLDYQHGAGSSPYDPQSFYKFFSRAKSKVIGISVMAKDLPAVLIGCKKLKEEKPDLKIILGGPGPTGTAKRLMEKFNFIDFVIRGEGEKPLLNLMKALKTPSENLAGNFTENLEKIKGLIYRREGAVTANSLECRIENLDELPPPSYEMINPSSYNQLYLPATRGCSHFCAFCDQPALWQGKEIRRSMESLFSEIDFIVNELKAPWEIAFADNEFCKEPQRFQEFLQFRKERGYRFPFSMDRRIDTIDPAFLEESYKAGCRLILYGVESGSDNVLKQIKKGFKSSHIKPGLLMSAKYIENSIASFMFNYPFETLHDFLQTVSLIYDLWHQQTKHFITFQLHYLSPLPRTPIFNRYKNSLIYKRVSNMMTARRNDLQYDYIIKEPQKKIIVLPKKQEDDDLIQGELSISSPVEKIVKENPEIFPSFFIYDSPDLSVKEEIIQCLHMVLDNNIKNVLFKRKDYFIYFGQKEIKTALYKKSQLDYPSCHNSFFWRITNKEIENPEQCQEFLNKAKGKTLLLSVDQSTLTPHRNTGKQLLKFLHYLKENKFAHILLTCLPKEYFSFTDHLTIQSQYKMPPAAKEAGDNFYLDEKGREADITTLT